MADIAANGSSAGEIGLERFKYDDRASRVWLYSSLFWIIFLTLVGLTMATLQGLLQAIPPVNDWMHSVAPADGSIAGAHAQVNIIGGVLLMLLGCAFSIGVPVLPEPLAKRLTARTGILMGTGALVYYASALGAAL